jgi:hypothetical protein
LAVVLTATFWPDIARGSCVGCHASLREEPAWAHSYQEWQESMHADQDITCEHCHGGDGDTASAAQAHASMGRPGGGGGEQAAGGPGIEARCGGCHVDEYAASCQGPHGCGQPADRRGARCLDCHGAVGDRVPAADDLPAICLPCHASGRDRVMVWLAGDLLRELSRLRLAVAFPERGGVPSDQDGGPAGHRRARAAEAVRAATAAWHRLDLGAIGRSLAEATEPGGD